MKILHVITSLRTGGAEKLVTELVPRLMQKGHQVDVALFDGLETPFKKELAKTRCKIYDWGHSMYNPWNIIRLIRIMKKYDVIHTHNTYPQLYLAIARIFVKGRIVTTEHSTNNRRRNYHIFRFLDRWMYGQYDKVICISDKAYDNLYNFLRKDTLQNVVTIYNGVDVEKFAKASPNNKYRTDGKAFVVIMVASLHWQKDQDTVIKAISKLPKGEFKFWIVGDGNRKEELRQLVKGLGVSDNVKFMGIHNDIPELLHTADAVVLSSHFEGLSLSSIEGMSVGKPFIASDVDGLHEVVEGAGILFPHQDANRLAEILLHLQLDKKYALEIAQKCYDRAKQYDIEKTVDAYEALYQSLKMYV